MNSLERVSTGSDVSINSKKTNEIKKKNQTSNTTKNNQNSEKTQAVVKEKLIPQSEFTKIEPMKSELKGKVCDLLSEQKKQKKQEKLKNGLIATELKEKTGDLSSQAQKDYRICLKNAIFRIGGWEATLNSENQEYLLDKDNLTTNAEKAEDYKKIKNFDHSSYVITAKHVKELTETILERISSLNAAHLSAVLEERLLDEAFVGNSSNFRTSLWLPQDYKYGTFYREKEALEALNQRKKALLIEEVTEPTKDVKIDSEVLNNALELLAKTVKLKEEACVHLEVFKSEALKLVDFADGFADYKRKSYFIQLEEYKALKSSFEKQSDKIALRIKSLGEDIKIESTNVDSVKLPPLKHEKIELEACKKKISDRLKEISDFLESYKIEEKEKPEVLKLDPLSSEHTAVFSLLKRIVAFKETVVMEKEAEKQLAAEDRKVLFFKEFKELKGLQAEITQTEKSYQLRKKELQLQAGNYESAVKSLKKSVDNLTDLFDKVTTCIMERNKWKLDFEVKKTEILSQSSSPLVVKKEESSGGIFSFFSFGRKSSTEKVESQQPPVVHTVSPVKEETPVVSNVETQKTGEEKK